MNFAQNHISKCNELMIYLLFYNVNQNSILGYPLYTRYFAIFYKCKNVNSY